MLQKRKIFIADDDETVLNSLKSLLVLSDFEVQGTQDARAIAPMVRVFKPDVLLLDLIMPDLGGFEVCELLYNYPETKGLPIIVISAIANFRDIKNIIAKKRPQGVVACVAKPYNFQRLLKIINKVILRK
jgi:CheY-like chemotaxis protein